LAKKKLEPLKIGEQRNGVLRKAANIYHAVVKAKGKKHKRSFGADYEAAAQYAEMVQQQAKLGRLKGHNPVLDQIARSKSRMTVGAVLGRNSEARAPFLKPGTIEYHTFLTNRLAPLKDINAEALSLLESNDYIAAQKGDGLSDKTIKELISFCKSAYKSA
jgi:hypothetical protein